MCSCLELHSSDCAVKILLLVLTCYNVIMLNIYIRLGRKVRSNSDPMPYLRLTMMIDSEKILKLQHKLWNCR